MTRGKSIMRIFCQNRYFSKVLVVWEARVQALVVWGTIRRNGGSLEGYIAFFPKLNQFPSYLGH
jgi:hypothetical protein